MRDAVDRFLGEAMADVARSAPPPPPWPGEQAAPPRRVRRASPALAAASAFVVLLAVGAAVYVAGRSPAPEPGVASRRVAAFPAPDGVTLRGDLHAGGGVGIVVAGALGAPLSEMDPVVEGLADLGYTVLGLDLRGHGRSGGDVDPAAGPGDLAAAAEFLRDEGATTVWVVGYLHSGTATAELAAADPGALDGLALLYPMDRYLGLDATRALPAVTDPVVLLGASPAVFRAAPPGAVVLEKQSPGSPEFIYRGGEIAAGIDAAISG